MPHGVQSQSDRGPGRSRLIAITAAVIATTAPLLLLLSNSDWFFTREGYLDPWNYVGLFHQYLDPDYLPEDYKLARLPWILSGLLVSSLLAPIPAAYTLHALFLCAGSLALFCALQTLFRRPVLAALPAMCLGFYTHGHGSGGWDYHNTASGAFLLVAFALSVLPAALRGSGAMLVAFGAVAALSIHTNVTLVNLVPALVYVHLSVVHVREGRLPSLRGLAVRAAWVLAGVALTTAILALVNLRAGREALFFSRLIDLVVLYVTDTNFQAGRPLWRLDWVLTARHLAIPLGVFLAGAFSVALDRRRALDAQDRVANALVVQFLAMVVLWAAWQSAGHTALDWDYMAYGLIPSCFIALGGLLYRSWPAWCERRWLPVLLGAAAVLTACLSIEQLPGAQLLGGAIQSFVFIGGSAILFVPLAVYRWRPSVASALVVVVVYAFDNRVVAPGYPDYLATDRCKVQASVYGAIVDAASWLMTDADPLYTRARIWFDENEIVQPLENCPVRLGHVANSIATMASMTYVARAFPLAGIDTLPDGAITALIGDRVLVIIASSPAHLDAWDRRLAGMGLSHVEIQSHRVPMMASGFTIHAWSINPAAQ